MAEKHIVKLRTQNEATDVLTMCVYIYGHVYTCLSIYVFVCTSDLLSLCGDPLSSAVVSMSQSIFGSLQVYCLSDEDGTRKLKSWKHFITGQEFGLFHSALHLRALCSGFHLTSACLSGLVPVYACWGTATRP